MGAIAAQSAERALELAHRLVAGGQHLQHFVREAVRHVRNLLIARVAGADSELVAAPRDEREALARQAAQFSEEDLTRFFSILLETEYDLRKKPEPALHLELGLLRMVNAMRLAPLEEALAAAAGEQPAGAKPGRAAPGSAATAVAGTMASAGAGAAAKAPPARKEPVARLEAPLAPAARTVARAAGPLPATHLGAVARAAGSYQGIEAVQVEGILSAVRGQTKMLAGLVEQVTRWELEGSEMRVYFPRDRSALAEMLETTRDAMDRLRAIASQVLGQPLRVCVKLDAATTPGGAPAARRAQSSELRAKFERDPVVRAMLERFGGEIRDVRRRDED